MRILFTFLLLVVSLSQGFTQSLDEEDLIGTWIPISCDQGHPCNTTFAHPGNMALNFEIEGTGYFEMLGNNDKQGTFSFKIQYDTIHLNSQEINIDYMVISHLNSKSFVAQYAEGLSVIYQRLEFEKARFSKEEVFKSIVDKTWIITEDARPDFDGIRFEPQSNMRDTSYFSPDEFPSLKTSSPRPDYDIREIVFWSLGTHQNQLFMKLYSSYESFFIGDMDFVKITEFNHKQFKFYGRSYGEVEHYTARLLKPPSEQKLARQIDWLTNKAWRISEEREHPPIDTTGLMDLGMVVDDFEALFEPDYVFDSTLVLTDADIAEKKLVLKFDKNGSYQVRRNERVIDRGNWNIYYDNTYMRLTSNTRWGDSDGIEMMDVWIEKISKNKLEIIRHTDQYVKKKSRKNGGKIETYRPEK